jgi:hypothetical protein
MTSATRAWLTSHVCPRRVLASVLVTWGEPGSPPLLVRKGTVLDITPGSALETAYGGAGNLEALTASLGAPDVLDKSWLAN